MNQQKAIDYLTRKAEQNKQDSVSREQMVNYLAGRQQTPQPSEAAKTLLRRYPNDPRY